MINIWVLQGWVLVLFLFYIFFLRNILMSSTIQTPVVSKYIFFLWVLDHVRHCLHGIFAWMSQGHLKFNLSQTKFTPPPKLVLCRGYLVNITATQLSKWENWKSSALLAFPPSDDQTQIFCLSNMLNLSTCLHLCHPILVRDTITYHLNNLDGWLTGFL